MAECTPIIAGNWKMFKTSVKAKDLVSALLPLVEKSSHCQVVVCPPFTALCEVATLVDSTPVCLGGQNCYHEDEGAFTGEVSPVMLKEVGCEFVIVGHSERRHYFGETNEGVNRKIKALYLHGLKPIVCVGETLEQRKAGSTTDVVTEQIRICLNDLPSEKLTDTVIAYEPVWAIGTGVTATPEQAQEVHALIRNLLGEMFDDEITSAMRIQYGGSVKPDNIKDLMVQEDIDGALVGGASLDAESFARIVNYNQ